MLSLIFWALGAGFLIGLFNLLPPRCQAKMSQVSTLALVALLYSMGARLGSDQQLMSDIGLIGLQSLGLALATMVGSVALVYGYEKRKKRQGEVDRS